MNKSTTQSQCSSPGITVVGKHIKIIDNKLYFCSTNDWQYDDDRIYQFNIDELLQYVPFHQDFGPLKISCIYKYVTEVERIMKLEENANKIFWHLTSANPKKYLNSILLICVYQILVLKRTAVESYRPFSPYDLKGFRDSLAGKSIYDCPVIQFLKGFQKAVKLQWFDLNNFNLEAYTEYQRIQNGDINQIIKDKIFAFSSPTDKQKDRFGKKLNSVPQVIAKLKELNIQIVIHLHPNQQFFNQLAKKGIDSHTITFLDNTSPDHDVIQKFIQIIEESGKKRIGVNCKTGLGKTGTMIGCYAIKKYQFFGPEITGWLRICRPGSVVGNQQLFLIKYGKQMNPEQKSNSDKKVEEETEVKKLRTASKQRRPNSFGKNNVQLTRVNKQLMQQIQDKISPTKLKRMTSNREARSSIPSVLLSDLNLKISFK